ncbi:hypothetical protein BOX15_Mlig034082g1 [Macrostomum lignano]|uniref:ANK_REP_REGION domain-containing protein n=2 Tax=Macrostomum lignano TaxID=282301 RepID=A0A267F2B0_9PLAT|nr:hypothetical protein BOX15_Mlig034082g1 [Macrostomum lignano]
MQNNFIALCRNGTSFQKFYDQLQKRDRLERRRIVNMIIEGATCLINSSRYGHLDFVRYLVEECEAELELTGSVSFDGEVIEGASPLWCAAAAGQLEVVKFLIAKGANVNKTTCTNSTPLRAACFDGHLNIVQLLVDSKADIEIANRHGHTCLMISCYKGHYDIVRYLLDVGADHQRQSTKGNTALHDAAESGNLRILKLLLDRGAQLRPDIHGVSPLLGAANSGHANIVDYLAGHPELVPDPAERVHAMELLGCTLVDKRRDWVSGLRRWRKALRLREGLRLPKAAAPRHEAAFAGAKEFQSAAELDEVAADPEAVRLQALMVRERILGSEHPDTAYYMRYRGAVYADQGQFESCLRLWLYALELQLRHASPFFPASLASFNNFIELFAFMLSSNARPLAAQWTEVLGQVLCRCVLELAKSFKALGLPFRTAVAADGTAAAASAGDSAAAAAVASEAPSTNSAATATAAAAAATVASPEERPLQYADRLLECLATLTALLVRAAAAASSASSAASADVADDPPDVALPLAVRQALFDVRCVASPLSGNRLIHFACQSSRRSRITERYPATQLPCPATVRLLLRLGAGADSVNRDGDTPLHLATRARSVDSVGALLSAGAHSDLPNSAGKSPLGELLLVSAAAGSNEVASDTGDADDSTATSSIVCLLRSARFTRLSCLCATAFAKSGQPLPPGCSGWVRDTLLAHCPPQRQAGAASTLTATSSLSNSSLSSGASPPSPPSAGAGPSMSYQQQQQQHQQSTASSPDQRDRQQQQSV